MWKPRPPRYRKFRKEVFTDIAAVSSFIYHIGDSPALRQPSLSVDPALIASEEYRQKIAYIKKCLVKYRRLTGMGVGIAGVQVGIPEKIAVIYIPKYRAEMITLINPVITKRSKELNRYPEICMSAAPAVASVIRPEAVEFDYLDENGDNKHWNVSADTDEGKRFNRVFQHEIDHLEGIINVDLIPSREIVYESDPKFYKRAGFEKVI